MVFFGFLIYMYSLGFSILFHLCYFLNISLRLWKIGLGSMMAGLVVECCCHGRSFSPFVDPRLILYTDNSLGRAQRGDCQEAWTKRNGEMWSVFAFEYQDLNHWEG